MADFPHPPSGLCTFTQQHKHWLQLLNQYGILYLYGMMGFGKTVQVTAFAEAKFKVWERFSAQDREFYTAVSQYLEAHPKPKVKTLLILDDLQWIFDPSARQALSALLTGPRHKNLYFFLISRAGVPAYLSPLWVTRQMAVEDQECLRLTQSDIGRLAESMPALAALPTPRLDTLIRLCEETANGYILGINALLQRAASHPADLPTALALAYGDIDDFLTAHLFAGWTKARQEAAISLSVFDTFTSVMARQLLGKNADEILQDFVEVGSFLEFQAPDTYAFNGFFRAFLQRCLHRRPEQAWKPLYETAGALYEARRDLSQALRCYKLAGRAEKLTALLVYTIEMADGTALAGTSLSYFQEIPSQKVEADPDLLAAAALLAAYRMDTPTCRSAISKLETLARQELQAGQAGTAAWAYIRILLTCPGLTAAQRKDGLAPFSRLMQQNGVIISNIFPTANGDSLLNGSLDLLPWVTDSSLFDPGLKEVCKAVLGAEAVGISDAALGELWYEQNRRSGAMAHLTKALSDANLSGSLRIQYAVTGVMARLFQAEGQWEAAEEILKNIRRKAADGCFWELLPNIDATLLRLPLLRNDLPALTAWLEQSAPNEHDTIFIPVRSRLLTKARAYTALDRQLEALYLISLLEPYALQYQRTYLQIQLLTLRAILLFRREEDWQTPLLEAAELAAPYELVRVFSDEGAALLPLWSRMSWPSEGAVSGSYRSVVLKELKVMAAAYPAYLKSPRTGGTLTRKEMAVLQLMSEGRSNAQIAQALGLNLGTAKFHVGNILKKLQADNRTVAITIAKEESLL